MSKSAIPTEATPIVTSLRIEYADGNHDEIQSMGFTEPLAEQPGVPLFEWKRRIAGERHKHSLYTGGAIAVLLFRTAGTGKRSTYSANDPECIRLYLGATGKEV